MIQGDMHENDVLQGSSLLAEPDLQILLEFPSFLAEDDSAIPDVD